jgi:hypothetical protein
MIPGSFEQVTVTYEVTVTSEISPHPREYHETSSRINLLSPKIDLSVSAGLAAVLLFIGL